MKLQMEYAFKASRCHEIDSKLEQHHLSGGGGIFIFAEIDLPRGEIHDARWGLFLFQLPRGGKLRATASRPKRWWWGG